MHIPALISDLAVMMLTAGVTTILFKKIKQPLVLGYILAGFLLSSYFPFYITVVDTANITTWSEIGIIFLLFHLGLEFNLHKLADVGGTAIITVIIEMVGIMTIGFFVGNFLGFGRMNSIFLGGMLCISSTTMIIKVFDELRLSNQKFTGLVFGTLVMEDILGIFMMIVLSTISVSQNISGAGLALKLSSMLLYLVVWLVLGIYLLPTFLNKAIKFMNDEMVAVMSVGLCFGMVLLANALGFSSALGAFLSGSLLAGTVHVERIEQLTKGIKDLFGAVFFLSVGMLVNPEMIVKYIVPILVITVVLMACKVVFPSLGMLFSGQSLDNSIKCGCSMAQIGEFAFIIASLGMSLGVTGDFLYPIVVSVSVITTFTTPYFIKGSPWVIGFVRRLLPVRLADKLNRYTSPDQIEKERDNDWHVYIKKYFFRVTVYGGLMVAATIFGVRVLEPELALYLNPMTGKIITCVIIYVLLAMLTKPFLNPHNNLFTALWLKRQSFRLPLVVLNLIKVAIITAIAMVPLSAFFDIHMLWITLILPIVIILISRMGFMSTWYLQLETRFLRNYNERIISSEEKAGNKQTWLDEKLHIISIIAPRGADYLEKHLEDLKWGYSYNVYVVKIRRGDKYFILPKGKMTIHAGDKVYIVGEKKALLNFYALTGLIKNRPIRTLKEFMDSGYEDSESALAICAVKIKGVESFAGKPLKNGNIREHWNCLILGMQKRGYPIIMPDPNMLIEKGDILWAIGSNNHVGHLAAEHMDVESELIGTAV